MEESLHAVPGAPTLVNWQWQGFLGPPNAEELKPRFGCRLFVPPKTRMQLDVLYLFGHSYYLRIRSESWP